MQTIQGIAERDLIVRLKAGDQTAFELLFHFYYPGLVLYACQFTADRADAEKIVQNFFVRFRSSRSLISDRSEPQQNLLQIDIYEASHASKTYQTECVCGTAITRLFSDTLKHLSAIRPTPPA